MHNSLPKGEVFLIPWTKNWEEEFLLEKQKIEDKIGAYVYAIHHIGSTSIKGLSAKPIIDIAIEIYDFNDGKRCAEPLNALNYDYRGTDMLPNRHYFSKGNPRTHHIHMHQKGDILLLDQLRFRDYLFKNETVRIEYEQLKIKLAEECDNNLANYTNAKSEFIKHVLEIA